MEPDREIYGLADDVFRLHIEDVLQYLDALTGTSHYTLRRKTTDPGESAAEYSIHLLEDCAHVPVEGSVTPSFPVCIEVEYGDAFIIESCTGILISPLPSRKTGLPFSPERVSIKTLETLSHFLFLHLCLPMVVIQQIGSLTDFLKESGLLPPEFVDDYIKVSANELSPTALRQHASTRHLAHDSEEWRVVYHVDSDYNKQRIALVVDANCNLLMLPPQDLIPIGKLQTASLASTPERPDGSSEPLLLLPPPASSRTQPSLGKTGAPLSGEDRRRGEESVRAYLEHCFDDGEQNTASEPHFYVLAAIQAILSPLIA
jgi:hypothetical protein